MERYIPSLSDVHAEAAATRRHRRQSRVHGFDHGLERMKEITGTVEGYEDPKRILGSFLFMAGLTGAAIVWPNHSESSYMSDTVAALGGAFIGETLAPISRRTTFDRRKYLKHMQDVPHDQFTDSTVFLFARYKDYLTDDEIRHRLRRTLPLEGEKPVSDKRYLIVDEHARRYAIEHKAEPKSTSTYKAALRKYVIDEIMVAQHKAQELRGADSTIRKEFYGKAGDIVSMVMVVALASEVINQVFDSSWGGALGMLDDLAVLATVIGSIALRNLTQESRDR